MLKVWGRKTSINVQKVMFAVGELGLEHERFDAGGPFGKLDTPEYTMLNPNQLVPTIDDGGFVLWESNAIVRHLGQRYGRGTLSPSDEQTFAKADAWMDWSLTTLYADIISTCFLQLIRTPASSRDQGMIDAAERRIGDKLGLLNRQLTGRAHLVGEQLTIADVAVGTLMYRYFNLPLRRPSLPNVEAWYDRLKQRPAYRTHVMIDFQSMKVEGA